MTNSALPPGAGDRPPGDDLSAEKDALGTQWLRRRPKPAPTYGMCLSCRSVEVRLDNVIGTRDLSDIGEHPQYPVGYGCEVCS